MKRRLLVLALATVTPLLYAQNSIVVLKTVGVFSLLGDSVQATAATDPVITATRIDRQASESLEFKGIGFDLIAIRVARESIQRAQPAATVIGFRAPAPLTVAEQRAVAEGATKAELPGWILKTIEANRLSHLLLVTRARGTMEARTGDNDAIGRGQVEGIGFFMDTLYKMRNVTTGNISTGLLAPYVQIRLTLMDAQSGDIVAIQDIKDAFAYASRDAQPKADPWTFMPAEEKMKTLRGMVEEGIARGMVQVVSKGR
jgi:hypothetical protein